MSTGERRARAAGEVAGPHHGWLRRALAGLAVAGALALVAGPAGSGVVGASPPDSDTDSGSDAEVDAEVDAETDDVWGADPADGDPAVAWLMQPSGAVGAGTRAYFEYDLDPGDWVEDVVGIINHSDTDLTLQVFGSDAFNDPATGAFNLLPTADEPRDVGSWVTFAADEVTVPARARMDVPFIVSVPANATPGDHAGGILTSYVSSPSDDGQVLDARIAIRIYLNVSGELRPELAIEDLDTSFAMSANRLTGSMTVGYTVTNTGNLRLGADEAVRLAAPFGIGLGEPASQDLAEVLPGNSVRREVTIEEVPAVIALRSEVIVDPVDIADRVPDSALDQVRATSTTIVVPWIWLVVLVGLVSLLVWRRRRRRRRLSDLEARLAKAERSTGEGDGDEADHDAPGRDDDRCDAGRDRGGAPPVAPSVNGVRPEDAVTAQID